MKLIPYFESNNCFDFNSGSSFFIFITFSELDLISSNNFLGLAKVSKNAAFWSSDNYSVIPSFCLYLSIKVFSSNSTSYKFLNLPNIFITSMAFS